MKSTSHDTQFLILCTSIVVITLGVYHVYVWRLLTPYSGEWYLDTNTDDPYIISGDQVIALNTMTSEPYSLKIDNTARILSGANPSTFQVIPYERVARDDDQVRYRGQEIDNINPSSFKLLRPYLCDDSGRWYQASYLTGAGGCDLLDPDEYQIASTHPKVLRRTNTHQKIYNDPEYLVLPIGIRYRTSYCKQCDISTRQTIGSYYSRDNKNYYYQAQRIPLQQYLGFRRINSNYGYSTDGINIYYQFTIVSGADVASFTSTPSGWMQDKYGRYRDGVFVGTQKPLE